MQLVSIQFKQSIKQEAFEKCWVRSPLRAAARAIHQVSLLSHASTVARRLRNDDDNNHNDNA